MTPEDTARACAQAMWADDRASQALGMEMTHIAPGTATLTMTVTEPMTNGHGTCHGGYLFTLADSAFAFACNSHGPRVVAQGASISFLAPGQLGDRLTATAREVHRAGRSGLYDVTVTREDGTVIAEFRGQSRTIRGHHLETE
ncbi:hydroxyphenylacetyl-CoA thioesterase PaaI [Ponticoccus sp. SC2-23]|uniref:hydroxyphenylacetyl-CoA thioesterase PaaI n=1 Tax=Alexandriicola marinus TaxID=2081710 RepID=UPI000FD97AC2|nr:hydroxyphenylacetyl-CoA thioesterase PaaI [Alexandriicola marinus]MBM1221703.1 hydroxyphenylacetyl-CoA thioesterase PaaI [Ponticoccus sp. SC6-9]MBM1226054.1 hydroxyphenylacetyl-CoA thioesterase PaaI [Ponticoccus sp. SC6-15]MBM1231351.1 hydroxyphenylacetyl-CoA thioesterase PaaI [Ponticoccus sp. SC6-38]MBM1235788.1 hydroxyphenylacetyl-CoA thioesterase PaaI [Ponticoccus sp. SC6-45]MBM1240374.1 hydroxyphenylacetyl-CoA thioesterase PaaI [Ponticoccus sp. SC6-49]MBM1244909.1 hydroxyphenylacetyl-C